MNSTRRQDSFNSAFTKNFISFSICVIINFINGLFVYTYFKSHVFRQDPRYVLYVHLVINDMIVLTASVLLQVMSYTVPLSLTTCCFMLVIIVTTNKNSPLNLAGMALERYIAVCQPLHHAQICTVRRAYGLIGLIWGSSFVPAFVDVVIILATRPSSVFSTTVICYRSGVYTTLHHKAKTVVVQVFLLSFVFLTLIVTYLKVLFAARAASITDQASARKARNTILLHGVQLLICMTAYLSPFINLALVAAAPSARTTILFSSFLLTNILPRLLSPLIYGVRDQKLRSHMRLYFHCRCCSSVAKRVKPMSGGQKSFKRNQKGRR